jgi:hypothetical protein
MAVRRPASLTLEPTGPPASASTDACGIVPNGNQTVTITTDRRRVTAPVVGNVYHATAPARDQGIAFHHHH